MLSANDAAVSKIWGGDGGGGGRAPFDFRSTPPSHPSPAPVHAEAMPVERASSAPQAPPADHAAPSPANAHDKTEKGKILGVTSTGGGVAAPTATQRAQVAVASTGSKIGDVVTATGIEVAELSKAAGAKVGELKQLYCDLGDRIEAAGVRAEAAVAAGAVGLREAITGLPVPEGGVKPAASS